MSAFTLTSVLTPLLAAKQPTLISATGAVTPILDGNTVRRLSTAGDESVVAMTESGGVITLTIDGYTKAQIQTLISNVSAALSDASVTGSILRAN